MFNGNPGVVGGDLVKTGTGSLTLSGQSTYSGTTTVRQGTLIAGGNAVATAVAGGGLDTLSGFVSLSSTNTIPNNSSGLLMADGDRVVLQSARGVNPTASTGVLLYVVNANATNFQIANTPGGTPLTFGAASNYAYSKLDTTKLASSTGGDTLSLPAGWSLSTGDVVMFNSLPANSGLISGQPFYVVSASGSNFKVSTYAGGPAIATLPAGSFGLVRPGVFGTGTTAIQLGDASTGANPVALLTGGAFTIERDIAVNNFGNGSTLGGNTADVSRFTGAIALGKNVALQAMAGGRVDFTNAITGGFGITKTGAGLVQLLAANSYSGATTISSGTLALGAAGTFANSTQITVGDAGSTGAVLDLSAKSTGFTFGPGQTVGGIGTIAIGAGTTVTIEGVLSPGNSPGLLTVMGDLALSGTALMEIDGVSPRGAIGGYDATDVSGLLTYGGSLLIDFGAGITSAFANNTTFNLFDFGSFSGGFTSITTPNDGSFYAGLTFGSTGSGDTWTATKGSQTLEFTHSTGMLVIVPEPSALALAGLGAGLAGWMLGRRRLRERKPACGRGDTAG